MERGLLTRLLLVATISLLALSGGSVGAAVSRTTVSHPTLTLSAPFNGTWVHSSHRSSYSCAHSMIIQRGTYSLSSGNFSVAESSYAYGVCYSYFYGGGSRAESTITARIPLIASAGVNSVKSNISYRLGLELEAKLAQKYGGCYVLNTSATPILCVEESAANLTITSKVVDTKNGSTLGTDSLTTGWIGVMNNVSCPNGTCVSTNYTFNGGTFGKSLISVNGSLNETLLYPMLSGHGYNLVLTLTLETVAYTGGYNAREFGSIARGEADLGTSGHGFNLANIVES